MEELKLILDTISQTTGAAKQFGFLWLGLEAMKTIIAYGLAFMIIWLSYKLLHKGINLIQDNSFAADLRDLIDPSSNYGPLIPSEKREIIAAIERGMEREP